MPAATSSIIRFESASKVFPGRGKGAEVRAVDEVTLDGLDPDAAIAWIRARYHPRAVETPWQRSWLRSW